MGSARILVADEIIAEAGGVIELLRMFPPGTTLDDVRCDELGRHELIVSHGEIPAGLHRADPTLERIPGRDLDDVVVFSWGLEDSPTY